MKSKCKHYDFELAQTAGISVDRFPETEEEAKAATDLLVQSLERLSMEEHETVICDIHGFDEVINEEETISFVNEKLAELQNQLDRIKKKKAYNLALKLNKSYVSSRSFRLMFLRCEKFNAQAAAEMMVLHFKEKQRLFGSGEILAREILQTDLGPNERTMVESGVLQIMKERDAAGRLILLVVTSNIIAITRNDLTNKDDSDRVLWYLSMASARDEESQKKGHIWLIMSLCDIKLPIDLYRRGGALQSAIPQRLAAGHFCYDDQNLYPFVTGFQLFIGEEDRIRIRTHFGTRDEIDMALREFGIPTDAIPIHKDGTCNLADHLQWLDSTRKLEMTVNIQTASLGQVISPHRFDVLFGKSSMAREHPGTLRALHLVQMYFATYEKLGKCQKTDVADTIISIIHESGGRFLKQSGKECWMEVPDVEARKKVAHWFRHARSKNSQCQQESVKRNSQGAPELINLNNHLQSIHNNEP